MAKETQNQLLSQNKDRILKEWLRTLEKNPEFQKNDKLKKQSEQLLENLISGAKDIKLPEVEIKEFKPVLEILDALYSRSQKAGLSEKDLATIIFTLKSSMHETFADETPDPSIFQFEKLLDFLGLFIFEAYAKNREKLLTQQAEEIKYLRNRNQEVREFDQIIGKSAEIKKVKLAINQALDSDISVLIFGETGTGKELVASAIHHSSDRKDKPFVVVNCGAIPENLLESELFGYEKGAFTGALERKLGKFEIANGGTIFLDEIGEMPKALQVKLLRVLQEKEIQRVGGHELIKMDVKFISATNRDLKEMVAKNEFREDLYYRLNVFPILIPPLRERRDDILLIAISILTKWAKKLKKEVTGFSLEAQQVLLNYDWPGNVRELENVISRAAVVTATDKILPSDLNLTPILTESSLRAENSVRGVLPAAKQPATAMTLAEAEKKVIADMIKLKNNNMRQAALALGISRTTLYNKAKEYGLI
jgi:two-component system response regulator AtoC